MPPLYKVPATTTLPYSKFSDAILALTDEELRADHPFTKYGETRQRPYYETLNEDMTAEASRAAFAPFGSSLSALSELGQAFLAEKRATKCARRNCSNTLGSLWRSSGRVRFHESVARDDARIFTAFVPYACEQLVDWDKFRWRKHPAGDTSGRSFFVDVREGGAQDWALAGYCAPDCMRQQEDADRRKRTPVPPKVAKVMTALGFKLARHGDKKDLAWYGGLNNTWARMDGDTITLTGYAPDSDHRPRATTLGEFATAQLADFERAVRATKPQDVVQKELDSLNAPTERERYGLRTLLAFAEERMRTLAADLAHRKALLVASAKDKLDVPTIEALLAVRSLEAQLEAAQELQNNASYRIEGRSLPSSTPLPHLLTADQMGLAKRDRYFVEKLGEFGLLDSADAKAMPGEVTA